MTLGTIGRTPQRPDRIVYQPQHPLSRGLEFYLPTGGEGRDRDILREVITGEIGTPSTDGTPGWPSVESDTPFGDAVHMSGDLNWEFKTPEFMLTAGGRQGTIFALMAYEGDTLYLFDTLNPRTLVYWGTATYAGGWLLHGRWVNSSMYNQMFPAGEWVALTLTWDLDHPTRKQTLYRNGVLQTAFNVTMAPGPGLRTGPTLYFLDRQTSAGYQFVGGHAVMGIWSRCLGPREVYEVFMDPWAMVRPAAPQNYLVPAAAPAGNPKLMMVM